MILKSKQMVFWINGLNLLIGSASKSKFWIFLIALYKEIKLILKSKQIVFLIKGLNLLLGFPNNKYPPNNKNYLRCLFLRGAGCGSALFHKFWSSHTYAKMIECIEKKGVVSANFSAFLTFHFCKRYQTLFFPKPNIVASVTKATTVHSQQLSQCPT